MTRGGSAGGERVLIVDDDPSIALCWHRSSVGEGYRCESATALAEARELLAGSRFDLLLSDVGLPDGSGLDLVEETVAADEHIAALVVSGLDEVALGEHALRIGAYGYIVKPFTANDVLIGVLGAFAHRRRELAGSARPARRRSNACASRSRHATPAPPRTSPA